MNRTPRQIEEDCEHALDRLVQSSEYLMEHPEIGDALFIDHAQGLDLREAIAFMREKIKTLTHNLEGGVSAKFFDIHIDPALSPNRGYMPARRMMSSILEFNRIAEQNGVRYRVACVSSFSLFQEREDVDVIRQNVFKLIEQTPSLDWLLFTEQPENLKRMLPPAWLAEPRANVWLGTTVKDQDEANKRIPALLAVPATVRIVGCAPLLGPIHLELRGVCRSGSDGDCSWIRCPQLRDQEPKRSGRHCPLDLCSRDGEEVPLIHWVLAAGESGVTARPMDVSWLRSIRDQCKSAKVPLFVTKLGGNVVDSEGYDVVEENGEIAYTRVKGDPDYEPLLDAARRASLDVRPASVSRLMSDPNGADPEEWEEGLRCHEFPQVRR